MIDDSNAVKCGTWLYGGEVKCAVRIVAANVAFGSGDYEDPPEIRDDRKGQYYYVHWETPGTAEFKTECGPYSTVDDAVAYVERQSQATVGWE